MIPFGPRSSVRPTRTRAPFSRTSVPVPWPKVKSVSNSTAPVPATVSRPELPLAAAINALYPASVPFVNRQFGLVKLRLSDDERRRGMQRGTRVAVTAQVERDKVVLDDDAVRGHVRAELDRIAFDTR